jgi:hypothetical protein
VRIIFSICKLQVGVHQIVVLQVIVLQVVVHQIVVLQLFVLQVVVHQVVVQQLWLIPSPCQRRCRQGSQNGQNSRRNLPLSSSGPLEKKYPEGPEISSDKP